VWLHNLLIGCFRPSVCLSEGVTFSGARQSHLWTVGFPWCRPNSLAGKYSFVVRLYFQAVLIHLVKQSHIVIETGRRKGYCVGNGGGIYCTLGVYLKISLYLITVSHPAAHSPNYITGVDKNSRHEKGYPKLYQTFEACFNELLFISIALKLLQILHKFDGNLIFLAKCGSDHTTADHAKCKVIWACTKEIRQSHNADCLIIRNWYPSSSKSPIPGCGTVTNQGLVQPHEVDIYSCRGIREVCAVAPLRFRVDYSLFPRGCAVGRF